MHKILLKDALRDAQWVLLLTTLHIAVWILAPLHLPTTVIRKNVWLHVLKTPMLMTVLVFVSTLLFALIIPGEIQLPKLV